MKKISYALCFLGLAFTLAGCAARGDCASCDKMNAKSCGKADCKCKDCKCGKKCDCPTDKDAKKN